MLSIFRFEEGFVKIRSHPVFRRGDKIASEDLSSAHPETLGKDVEVRRVLRHLRFGDDALHRRFKKYPDRPEYIRTPRA